MQIMNSINDKEAVKKQYATTESLSTRISVHVKSDDELHNAYELILLALISHNNESAAVILDEYRAH